MKITKITKIFKIQICKCKGAKKDNSGWSDCSMLFVKPFEKCPNGCKEDYIVLRSADISVFIEYIKEKVNKIKQ